MALDGVEKESVAKLRKLLEAEPGLKAPTDSADLLRFLRLRKYDVAAALDNIKRYCAIRASAPKMFEGLCEPEKLRELTEDIVTVLPQKNLHGRVVIVGKFGKWKPSKVSQIKLVQALVLCLEYVSRDPAAQTAGISWVADFEGWSLGNMLSIELRTTRNYMHYLQNCVPVLLSEAHVLRQPAAFDVLYAFLRPFVRDEIIKAVRFHGKNVQGLHADVPPNIIPEEYGGTASRRDLEVSWTNICQGYTADNSQSSRTACHATENTRDWAISSVSIAITSTTRKALLSNKTLKVQLWLTSRAALASDDLRFMG